MPSTVDGRAVAPGNKALLDELDLVPAPLAADPDTPHLLDRGVMMTGDNRRTADALAQAIGGVDEIYADVLPDQKQAVVEQLSAKGRKVAMTGDGINDTLPLAAADVGIAMGAGSDVTMERASVTLVEDDHGGIVLARD